MHTALREIGVTGPQEGLALISVWAGRRIDNTTHLTRDEIGVVNDRLSALLAIRADDQREDVPPDHQDDDGHQDQEEATGDAEPDPE
jgi:hypothetical protein